MEVIEPDYFMCDFGKYCKTCKYEEKADNEFPCDMCLDKPTNLHSRIPVKWEKK